MNLEQTNAYIHAQTAAMTAEIEGMKAENDIRKQKGLSIAYDENAFFNLIDQYGLSHNGILGLFSQATE